jgi:spore germination protein GerM
MASRAIGASTKLPTSTSTAGAPSMTVYAYFTQGGKLVRESRRVSPTQPLRESLDLLLAGPEDSGHYTQIPRGTQLLDVNLAGANALVNLSSQAQNIQGSPAIPLFLSQIVATATQFPNVRQVTLQIAGRPVRSLGGEGMAIPEPLDQATVERMLQSS